MTAPRLPHVVHLSPAELRAWLALLCAPEAGLLRTPGVVLAHTLGVSRATAGDLLAALVHHGAACKVGARGVLPRPPGPACEVHRHDQDAHHGSSTCGALVRIVTPLADPYNWPASTCTDSVSFNRFFALCTSCFCISTALPGGTMAKTPSKPGIGVTSAAKVAAALRPVAAVYSRPAKSPASANRVTDDDRYLATLYVARRRRLDPTYEPLPGLLPSMVQLRKLLTLLTVGRAAWPDYMTFAFDVFPAMTGGKCTVPPPHNVAGEKMVDRFVCSLGERKPDLAKAERMLRGAGFMDVHIPTVLAIVRQAARDARPATDGVHASPSTLAAIAWLEPRLAEVGYASTPGGGE